MNTSPRASTQAPRVVLDTNACLDLWLFADPRARGLGVALERSECIAVGDARSRAEWERVLDYAQLALDPERRAVLLSTWDARVQRVDPLEPKPIALPRCADPDDQFWLELARDADAIALITRDAALLALDQRTFRVAGFRVITPQAFLPAATLRCDGGRPLNRP